MNTGGFLYEVQNIDKELVRLRKRIRELNQRKKHLLNQIIDTMKEYGETNFIYQGKTYKLEEHKHRIRKNEKQKHQDTLDILNAEGFHKEEAEEMYEKLLDAYRGPESVSYKLRK